MTAITLLAAIVSIAVVVLPPVAELTRVNDEQRNPIRRLRVPRRRNQVQDLSASGSFA